MGAVSPGSPAAPSPSLEPPVRLALQSIKVRLTEYTCYLLSNFSHRCRPTLPMMCAHTQLKSEKKKATSPQAWDPQHSSEFLLSHPQYPLSTPQIKCAQHAACECPQLPDPWANCYAHPPTYLPQIKASAPAPAPYTKRGSRKAFTGYSTPLVLQGGSRLVGG